MCRKVGFIVEGPSDKPVVEALIKGMDFIPIIRIAGGSKILTASEWITSRLYEAGAEKVIALVDSHCHPDIETFEKKVKEKMGRIKGLTLCIVIHAIESWMLSDEKALGNYLHSEVPHQTSPEESCRPEEDLNRIFHIHGKGRTYLKRTDAPGIAAHLDRATVQYRCRSFARFLEVIET